MSRSVARLFAGRLFGSLGVQMLILSGIVEAYRKSGSTLATGALGAALFAPSLLLNIVAGRWADQEREPARAYLLLQIAFVAVAAFIVWFQPSGFAMSATFFALASLRTLRTPFFYSLSHGSGGAANLARASALSWQIPLVAGPVLFHLTHAPEVVALGLLAIAAALSWRLEAGAPPSRLARDAVVLDREWLTASLLDAFVMGSLSFVSLLPFFLARLNEDPSRLGTLRAASGAGTLLCLWLFDHPRLRPARSRLFTIALFSACVTVFAIPWAKSVAGLAALCGAFGFLDGFSILYRDFLLFQAPSDSTGRRSALAQVLNSVSEDLGELRAGAMGAWIGPVAGVRASAALGALVGFGLLRFGKAHSRSTGMREAHART